MDVGQIKQGVQDVGKLLGALLEDKLGSRSSLEEQVRTVVRGIEMTITEALKARGGMSSTVNLKIKKLEGYKGELPAYATPGAAGLDVRALLTAPVTLAPGERSLIATGLAMEIPAGHEVQVRPRSGLAISKGLGLVNSPGTIDADYRGEIKIIVINLGQESITINDQERIAQFVVCPVVQAEIEDATDLSGTERGSGGFGSTGL